MTTTPPTLVGLDSFAHQQLQTSQAGSGFKGTYSQVNNSSVITFDSGVLRTTEHTVSLKMAYDGVTAASVGHAVTAGTRVMVWSYYLRATATPGTTSVTSFTLGPTGNGSVKMATDGSIHYDIGGSGGQVIAGNYADGNWHLISARFDCSTATFTMDVSVDGVAGTQSTAAGTAADITFMKLGTNTNGHTGTFWFQDMVWSATSTDHPISKHICLWLYPNAEGTDNLLSHIASDSGGTSNLYQAIDDWNGGSPDTATYIKQTATDVSAYAEVTFTHTTKTGIWALEGVLAGFASATTADTADLQVLQSGGTAIGSSGLIDYSGSTTVLGYHKFLIAASGLTQTIVNAMKARFGFSTSGTTNPYLSALIIQYAADQSAVSQSADAIILKTFTKTHSTDAQIVRVAQHATDADIKKAVTVTQSADAYIKSQGVPSLAGMDSFAHQVAALAESGSGLSGTYKSIANAGVVTFDTGNIRNPSNVASLKIAEDGVTAASVGYAIPAGNRQIVWSVYVRATAHPTVKSTFTFTTGPTANALIYVNTDGTVVYSVSGSNQQKVPVPDITDGNWHLVSIKFDCSTSVFTTDCSVDGVPGPTSSKSAQTPADVNLLKLGTPTNTHTGTYWYQDMVWSLTAGDHPIPSHYVNALYPDGEGTDNLLSHITDQSAGTTNLWQQIDDWNGGLPDTATYVQQTATDASAYFETTLTDTALNNVWDAQGVLAGFASATTIDAATGRVFDPGSSTSSDVGTGIDYSGSTTVLGYFKQMLTRPAGAWTAAKLNAQKFRWGFSTSAGTKPYLSAFMLEYASPINPPVTVTKTHTTDADLIKSATKTHGVDAYIKGVIPRTHLTDADIKKSFTKTHTTDAQIVPGRFLKMHLSDALISTSQEYAEGYGSGGYLGPTIVHTIRSFPGSVEFRHLDIVRESPSARDQYLTALGLSHRIRIRVFVLNASETTNREISSTVLTGQVDLDVTNTPARTCQLDILDPKYRLSVTEPAGPAFGGLWAGSLIRVYYDVFVPALGSWVMTPVFTGPVQTFGRDGVIVHLQCVGKESFMLPPNRYDGALSDIQAGTTRATLEALLDNIGEPQGINWQGDTERLDKSFDSLREFTNGQSSYLSLAKSIIGAQHIFYYDGFGTPTVRHSHTNSVLDITDYVLTPVSQSFDMSTVRNRARALITTKPPATETVTIQGGDAFSPGKLGRSNIARFIEADLPARKYRKIQDARDAATSLLTRSDEIQVTLDVLPIPFLEQHDHVHVVDSAGSHSTFSVTQFSLPLHIGGGMSLNYNRRILDPKNAGARFKRQKAKHGKH